MLTLLTRFWLACYQHFSSFVNRSSDQTNHYFVIVEGITPAQCIFRDRHDITEILLKVAFNVITPIFRERKRITYNTYPSSKQWAAVRIHLSLITEPPQYKRLCLIGINPNKNLVTILPRKLTSQGQSPFVITFPPIIRFFLESISVNDTIYVLMKPFMSITNCIYREMLVNLFPLIVCTVRYCRIQC
jgi:hypothetical protein